MPFYDEIQLFTEKSVAKLAPLLAAVSLAAMVGVFASTLSEANLYDTLFVKRNAIEDRLSVLEIKLKAEQAAKRMEGQSTNFVEISRVKNIENKQKYLELALGNDIEKVVSVAMLRRDVDELKNGQSKRIDRLEGRIESLNQLLLWISGSIISVILAAFGWIAARRPST